MVFKSKKRPLNILFVTLEAAPFAKVGGLGSVMYSLPRALRSLGHDVRVFLPRYLQIDPEEHGLVMEYEGLRVPTDNQEGPSHLTCNVRLANADGESKGAVTTYFLENQEYYEQRANVYGYADDPVRFALFCRGVLEFLRTVPTWRPDIIVCTDWQTGFLPNYLRTIYKDDPVLSEMATIFSINNLAYQGMFDHNFTQEMDFDDGHSELPALESPRLLKINGMRRGIIHADAINTVSPTYAKEMMTKEYGEGLADLLRERRAAMNGILNGIDYTLWNPTRDPYIDHNYSRSSLEKRAPNKAALQYRFGLPVKKDVFVLGIVSRLVSQKGFDLLYPIAKTLLRENKMQLVVLGEGSSEVMKFFYELETSFPEQVATHLKFDPVLPHIIYAGADAILIPSRFEPSGLAQMEAMRMGAIPIVRKTGGLADTVADWCFSEERGTGFVFEQFDSLALLIAITRAIENFQHPELWRALQERAMGKDFSWEASATQYSDLFERAMALHKRARENGIKPY